MRSPFARALALATFALAFARPAHAWFPNHTDAVPVPAVDFGFPLAPNGATFSLPPQMVDLDQDGRAEILAISDQGTLYAVGSVGVPDGGYPHAFGEQASGPPAVGDLNLDGNPDVVIVFKSGRVKVLTGAGAFLFQSQVPGTPVGGPVLTELDGSGRQCILVATADGKLHALDSSGAPVAGFPLTGPGVATGGAFTFLAADNFPRIGYLASPGGAAIWRKTAVDAPYSFDPGVPVGPGMPVSGPRPKTGLNDADNLYLAGRGGQLWRFDPDVIIGGGGDPVALAGVGPDSVLDTPCLFDVDGDLIPEIALRSYKADTLSIWIKDSEAGTTLAAFPQKFPGSEERRVGKEWRSRQGRDHEREKFRAIA